MQGGRVKCVAFFVPNKNSTYITRFPCFRSLLFLVSFVFASVVGYLKKTFAKMGLHRNTKLLSSSPNGAEPLGSPLSGPVQQLAQDREVRALAKLKDALQHNSVARIWRWCNPVRGVKTA